MKLVVGVILLIIGVGMIPTGYVINNSANNRIDQSIPAVLLEIRAQFLPEASKMIKFEGTPEVLLGIRDGLIDQIPDLLNGSVSAQTINGTIDALGASLGDYITARDMFFNDPAWSTNTGGIFPIDSISEVIGSPLAFSLNAQVRLLNGYGLRPGLVTDLNTGSGLTAYLEDFYEVDTPTELTQMVNAYNATWDQLEYLTEYLTTYLFPLVPSLGGLPFPATQNTASTYFQIQWANATLNNESISLPIGAGVKAWEIGVEYENEFTINYNPSNFTLLLCNALWNETNPYSPFNSTNGGYHYWYDAITNNTANLFLLSEFEMSSAEFDLFVTYLFEEDFRNRVIVPVIEEEQGRSYDEIVLNSFYLQWATGFLIPTGISSLGSEFALLEGFEITLPPANFTLGTTTCRNLWDVNNQFSLINASGIQDWLVITEMETDHDVSVSVEFSLMDTEFGLGLNRVLFIRTWLNRFRSQIVPALAFESGQFFMHPTEFANRVKLLGLTLGGILGFLGVIFILDYRKR